MTTAAWHKVRVGNRVVGSQQRVLATSQAEAVLAAHEAWPGRAVRYIAPVESATKAAATTGGAGDSTSTLPEQAAMPVDELDEGDAVGEVNDAVHDETAPAGVATPEEERQQPPRVESTWRTGYGYGDGGTYAVGTYAGADYPVADYDWWSGGYVTGDPECTYMQDETSHVQEHVR